jgi:hypothetical protein
MNSFFGQNYHPYFEMPATANTRFAPASVRRTSRPVKTPFGAACTDCTAVALPRDLRITASETETPGFYAETPRFYFETPRFYLETPRFYSETPRFYFETPRFCLETPRFYFETPRFYSETPRFYPETPGFRNAAATAQPANPGGKCAKHRLLYNTSIIHL